ncbi:MAG TPA: hypothetical protein ENH99_01805 [Candidatus Pacearchaeota archaeon]|nr:hypothetical protein [Candidatus Pacearchaeota archaeon]
MIKERVLVEGNSGQFYLIAAIIISTLLIGIVAVTNYSKREPDSGISNLKEELEIEGAKVIDYGTNKGSSQVEMYRTMMEFTNDFISKEGTDKNFYFLFGNDGNFTISGYQGTSDTVLLDGTTITSASGVFSGSINPVGTNAVLSIDSNEHTFKINNGENFYFVISKEIGDEEIVLSG